MFSMDVWSPIIVEVLTILILGLTTMAARWLISWLKAKGITEQIAAKEELALMVVGFVEQGYRSLGGPQKFDIAIDRLATLAKGYGLKISSSELHALIEDAVLQVKGVWIEE